MGDVSPDRAIARAGLELDGWSGLLPADAPMPPVQVEGGRRETRIQMPGKAQTDIAYGFVAIRRLDPRYYAYWMMNTSSVSTDWWTVGRQHPRASGHGVLRVQQFRRQPRRGPADDPRGRRPRERHATLEAIDFEVRRMAGEGPTPDEVEDTRRYLIGSIPRLLETNHTIAVFLQAAEQFGLGIDYDRRLPQHLRDVTIDQVRAAAAETLVPERAAIAIAGPPPDSR